MDAQLSKRTSALVAFGSNVSFGQSSPQSAVENARDRLNSADLGLRHASALYRTPCFPQGAGPDFVNACAVYESDLDPVEILARCHAVEAEFGRERILRWGQRTMDIDLLAVGDVVLPSREVFARWAALPPDRQAIEAPDRLILPHPRLQDRGFVLVPLAEVAPQWRHPVFDRTVAQMLAALPEAETAGIHRL